MHVLEIVEAIVHLPPVRHSIVCIVLVYCSVRSFKTEWNTKKGSI